MLNRFSAPVLAVLGLSSFVAACTTYVDAYEEAVYDMEPIYCYQTIGGTQCHRTPKHSDEDRLVNYYGPHPSKYEKPAPLPERPVYAPPAINFFVRDFEPIPNAVPRKDLREELPWKTEAVTPPEEAVKEDIKAAGTEQMKLPEQARVYIVDREGAKKAQISAKEALYSSPAPVEIMAEPAPRAVQVKGIPTEIPAINLKPVPKAVPQPDLVTVSVENRSSDVLEIEELE